MGIVAFLHLPFVSISCILWVFPLASFWQWLLLFWCKDVHCVLISNVHLPSQNWQEVVSKASELVAHSVVSVKVTSDISALCNASNDMGTEVKVFSIKASKSSSNSHWNMCVSGSWQYIHGVEEEYLISSNYGVNEGFLAEKVSSKNKSRNIVIFMTIYMDWIDWTIKHCYTYESAPEILIS